MNQSYICICCRRRFPKTTAVISEEYLGICPKCDKKIKYVKPGTVLPGKDSLDSLFAPLYYIDPIKSAIGRFKFASQTRYAEIFCKLLYDFLKDWHLEKDFDFITAVPLSRKRLYERGYSQTDLLAKPLAGLMGIPYIGNCLYKKRHNPKQSRLNIRSLRYENVRDAYLADTQKVDGKNILLLDDIYTSGATISSCAAELKSRGAKSVVGITLAAVIKTNV